MPYLSRGALAATAIALFPVLPATAAANVSVERSGNQLTIVASGPSDSGEVNVNRFVTEDDPDYPSGVTTVYVDSSGLGAIESSSCSVGDDNVVYCANADLTGISVDLSGTTGGASASFATGIVAPGVSPSVDVIGSPGDDYVSADSEATYGIALAGGNGNDTAQLGAGDDLFQGGAGNDVFRSSQGDDRFEGGAGNDELDAGTAPDGADTFDGGSDDPSDTTSRMRGDAVVYSDREAPVTARLAAVGAVTPTTGGGETGENDGFVNVESIDGGQGADELYGNDADNDLWGRDGADLIDGGDGDDQISGDGGADDVRGGAGDDFVGVRGGSADVDTAIDCGTGDDTVVRDLADPAHPGCEEDAPGFVSQRPTIAGTLSVGSALTLTGLTTFGDPGTVTAGWGTCATPQYDDCREAGTGTGYALQAGDLGRYVYAYASVTDAHGITTDQSGTELSGPVAAAALPAATPVPTPVPTPPAFGVRAAQTAAKALGGTPTLAKGFAPLGAGVQVFVPGKGSTPKAVKLTGKKPAPVAAVVCETACKLKSELSLTVTSKKTKKTSTIKLPATKKDVKPGDAAVVTAKLSAAAKKAIASSSKTPTLTVKLTVGEGKAKKTGSQKLKVAKP